MIDEKMRWLKHQLKRKVKITKSLVISLMMLGSFGVSQVSLAEVDNSGILVKDVVVSPTGDINQKVQVGDGVVLQINVANESYDITGEGTLYPKVFKQFAEKAGNPRITKIRFLEDKGKIKMPSDASEMFKNNNAIQHFVGLNKVDFSNVTKAGGMFYSTSSLLDIDLQGVDLSSVTDMSYMFYGASSLKTIDFRGANLSSVTDMGYMFNNATSLTSVNFSGLDLSSVTSMRHMFDNATSLPSVDFSGLDLSSVTNMRYMFNEAHSLKTIDFSGLDLSSVTDMYHMFDSASSLTSVNFSGLDLSSVTSMYHMFNGAISLTSVDFRGVNLSSVTDMGYMFNYTKSLKTLNLQKTIISGKTDISRMTTHLTLKGTVQQDEITVVLRDGTQRTFHRGEEFNYRDVANSGAYRLIAEQPIFGFEVTIERAKEIANEKIDDLEHLTNEEKAKYKKDIEGATTKEDVSAIVNEATNKDTEKAIELEKAKLTDKIDQSDIPSDKKQELKEQVNNATTINLLVEANKAIDLEILKKATKNALETTTLEDSEKQGYSDRIDAATTTKEINDIAKEFGIENVKKTIKEKVAVIPNLSEDEVRGFSDRIDGATTASEINNIYKEAVAKGKENELERKREQVRETLKAATKLDDYNRDKFKDQIEKAKSIVELDEIDSKIILKNNESNTATGEKGEKGDSAYEVWKTTLNPGDDNSVDAFIKAITGKQGEAGQNGTDGTAGANGKSTYEVWKETVPEGEDNSVEAFIKAITGAKGEQGDAGTAGTNGKSAFDLWREIAGNDTKSQDDFFDFLKGDKGDNGTNGENGKSAYDIWVESLPQDTDPADKTKKKFLESLVGKNGVDGKDAYTIWKELPENASKLEDEKTVEKFIESLKGDTGANGQNGQDGANGKSAYEVWKETLNPGDDNTVQAFIKAITGKQGEQGEQGKSAYDVWKENLQAGEDNSPEAFIKAITGAKGDKGEQGEQGKSAYDIWKETVPEGEDNSPDAFIKAITGKNGHDGVNGANGQNGADGKSAFDLWREIAGNDTKTQDDFFDFLKGRDGVDGKSAYDIWVESLPQDTDPADKTKAKFLESLVGKNGVDGKSAYDIWKELPENASKPGDEKTVAKFIESLKGKNGATGTNGKSAYEVWKETVQAGDDDSVEAFIKAITGKQGEKGDKGDDGKSAYEIWKELPENQGKLETELTKEKFIEYIKGLKGDKGDKGDTGKSAFDLWRELPGNENKSLDDFFEYLKGKDGKDGATSDILNNDKYKAKSNIDKLKNIPDEYKDKLKDRIDDATTKTKILETLDVAKLIDKNIKIAKGFDYTNTNIIHNNENGIYANYDIGGVISNVVNELNKDVKDRQFKLEDILTDFNIGYNHDVNDRLRLGGFVEYDKDITHNASAGMLYKYNLDNGSVEGFGRYRLQIDKDKHIVHNADLYTNYNTSYKINNLTLTPNIGVLATVSSGYQIDDDTRILPSVSANVEVSSDIRYKVSDTPITLYGKPFVKLGYNDKVMEYKDEIIKVRNSRINYGTKLGVKYNKDNLGVDTNLNIKSNDLNKTDLRLGLGVNYRFDTKLIDNTNEIVLNGNKDNHSKEFNDKFSKQDMLNNQIINELVALRNKVSTPNTSTVAKNNEINIVVDNFDSGRCKLTSDHIRTLEESFRNISTDREIIIIGYTDTNGSDRYNLDLGFDRAMLVKKYLNRKGYSNITIKSTGFNTIISKTDFGANRRVEITVK